MSKMKKIFFVSVVIFCFWFFLFVFFQPSHDREWEFGQELLPRFVFQDDNIFAVENFRDFDWESEGVAESRYETRLFNLDDIVGTDVFISHFDDFEGLAHIFLSFGFSSGERLVVSLETRREAGEDFSPLGGVL
ncbi:MAG: hypothetical protein KC736_01025 [Candidatus Moranbacteria bacterium]|nr:hypothetical protein [Candidatus Moranbacteria bacterium]